MITSACIVAIGTEVTSGQIANTNATWLANELGNLHIDVKQHLATQDDLGAIVAALEFATKHHDLIVLTGGLGPTNDDITRDGIAKWANLELLLDEDSWQKLQERARALNLTPNEQQKRQCILPKGATIFANSAGAAPGFAISHRNAEVIALPGPPSEVRAVWNDHAKAYIRQRLGAERAETLRTFDCLNITESQLAGLIEGAALPSKLRVGYRIHAPYVELKVWTALTPTRDEQEALEKILATIAPVLVARDGEDLARTFLQKAFADKQTLHVNDDCTQGYLATRLNKALSEIDRDEVQLIVTTSIDAAPRHAKREARMASPTSKLGYFALRGDAKTGQFIAAANLDGQKKQSSIQTNFTGEKHATRNRQIAAELALKYWLSVLS